MPGPDDRRGRRRPGPEQVQVKAEFVNVDREMYVILVRRIRRVPLVPEDTGRTGVISTTSARSLRMQR